MAEKEFDKVKEEMFSKGWSACFEEMNNKPITILFDIGLFTEYQKIADSKNGKNGKSKQ